MCSDHLRSLLQCFGRAVRPTDVDRARDIDEHFAEFISAWSSSLLQTATLLSRNPSVAEELVQATLVALYPRWSRVVAADSPIAFVRRSMINRFLSEHRRRSLGDRLPKWLATGAPSADIADAVSDRDVVRQLLAVLPERQRVALVLRHFHDLSDQQAADVMGCKVGTVRSLISRALATLRASQVIERPLPTPNTPRREIV